MAGRLLYVGKGEEEMAKSSVVFTKGFFGFELVESVARRFDG